MSARIGLFKPLAGSAGVPLNLWRELASFTLIFMELSWITPWYIQLVAPTIGATPPRVFAVFFIILTGIYVETRLVEVLRITVRIRLILFLIYFVLSALFGLKFLFYFQEPFGLVGSFIHLIQVIGQIDEWIPREFTGIFTIFLLNLNGVRLGLEPPEPYRVFRGFWIGIGAFLLLGLIYRTLPAWISFGMLALFLLFALVGMCSARFALLGRLRGSQRIPFDRLRILEVGLFTGGLVGVSILVASLVRAPAPFLMMEELAYLVFRILLILVALIMAPAFLIMSLLFPNLQPIPEVAHIISLFSQILDQLRELFAFLTRGLQDINFRWILDMKPVIRGGLLVLVAGLVCLWVYHLYRQMLQKEIQDREQPGLDESFARLERPGWRNPFRFLLGRLGMRPGWSSSGRIRAAERIRLIYSQLCLQAALLGKPRPDYQTPLEYLSTLQGLYPGRQADLEAITQAYLRVRYGELPETYSQVETVLAAWEHISHDNTRLLKNQKNKPTRSAKPNG